MIFLEQFRLCDELPGAEQFSELVEHPFADAGNGENLLGIVDDVFDLLRMIFNRLRCIPVRANAERILSIDFQQVGSLEKNVGDGLVVHGRNKGKSESREELQHADPTEAKDPWEWMFGSYIETRTNHASSNSIRGKSRQESCPKHVDSVLP